MALSPCLVDDVSFPLDRLYDMTGCSLSMAARNRRDNWPLILTRLSVRDVRVFFQYCWKLWKVMVGCKKEISSTNVFKCQSDDMDLFVERKS